MNELLRELLFLPPQGSSIARSIDTLHFAVITTTMCGALIVALIGAVFLIRFRRRGKTIPITPHFVTPLWLEIVLIGGLLGLFCGWWVIGFTQYRSIESPPSDAIPVYVTAKQWMWEFGYPSGPTSANLLVVPVGRPVKLIMGSRDVIHSFYVPQFRLKQDVIPGHTVMTWFQAVAPGTFEVLCTQYCGTRHSMMRAQVVALPGNEFDDWLEASTGPLALPGAKGDGAGLAERGREVAAKFGCLRCHSVDGSRFIGPSWAHAYGAIVHASDGRELVADEAYLTESMMDPRAVIVAGFQPVMPSYQGVLAPADTSAILEYIRSLRDVAPTATVPPPAESIHFEEPPHDASTR